MSKAVVFRGKIAFPHLKKKSEMSGKYEFNLIFDKSLTTGYEKKLMSQVAALASNDHYLNLAHPPVKCGEELALKLEKKKKRKLELDPTKDYKAGDEKQYEDFKPCDYVTFRSDNDGNEFVCVDKDGTRLAQSDIGFNDEVNVVFSVGVGDNSYGKQIYLNVSLIQRVEKAERTGGNSLSTEDALAAVDLDAIKDAVGVASIGDDDDDDKFDDKFDAATAADDFDEDDDIPF